MTFDDDDECFDIPEHFYVTETLPHSPTFIGDLAQLVERVLSMHEVRGSIPLFSTFASLINYSELPFEGRNLKESTEQYNIKKCSFRSLVLLLFLF